MRWWWVGDDAAAMATSQALGALAEWSAPIRFSSAEEAIAAPEAQAPALVVAQMELPCASGIHLAHVLRRRTPRPRVLVVGASGHPVFAIRARKAGARGYQRLDVGPQALAEALLAVAAGRVAIDRETVAAITAASSDAVTQGLARLTPREFEVMLMALRGRTLGQIAVCLGLKAETVSQHLDSACRRSGAGSDQTMGGLGALLGL